MSSVRRPTRWRARRRTILLASVAALVTGSLSYAFTATNTFGTSQGGRAGDGSTAVTGYSITAVHYTLDEVRPQRIKSWEITLNNAPDRVHVVYSRILDGSGSPISGPNDGWIPCSPQDATGPFTCIPSTQPTTYLAMTIEVAASSA
jgi:hypothetical protein